MSQFQLIECPRDAMQGWPRWIDTANKVAYINQLLKVGFHTIDFGSFVSPKAIPQMADTAQVLSQLDISNSSTQLLAIVANLRGAQDACKYQEIKYLGFPFSISPTFQLRNTNSTIEESLQTVETIIELCAQHQKELVIYLSMGFGNPYGDEYNDAILMKWADAIAQRGVRIISLADTVGIATPNQIQNALQTLLPQYPKVQFGVHLHATPDKALNQIKAAIAAGCTRIDTAIKGIGGCPMAQNELVGNINTELVLPYLQEQQLITYNSVAFEEALQMAHHIFAA